jgi:hypothetical protein
MEQIVCPSQHIGWGVQSGQSYKSKRTPKNTLELGRGPSKSFGSHKRYHHKRSGLAYPNYSKIFEIYTDSSSKQLRAVITQDNRPIAFFSRKLSIALYKYSVTKIELLAIVETPKECKGMLWGQTVKVCTDHKNLMRDALGLMSEQVYQWRLLLEEYGPKIVHIKGIHNTIADAISWLEYEPGVD